MSVIPLPTFAASTHIMPVTLGQLVAAQAVLERLQQEKLPATAAYRLAKVLRLTKVETAHFHEQREAYIRELGVETTPQTVEVPPDLHAEFFRRVAELAAVPVTLACDPLRLADLPDMTPADMEALDPLISPIERPI